MIIALGPKQLDLKLKELTRSQMLINSMIESLFTLKIFILVNMPFRIKVIQLDIVDS
jgi:hypothetical protein